MLKKKKIIRVTTVPTSLETFCKDMLRELNERYEVVAVLAIVVIVLKVKACRKVE